MDGLPDECVYSACICCYTVSARSYPHCAHPLTPTYSSALRPTHSQGPTHSRHKLTHRRIEPKSSPHHTLTTSAGASTGLTKPQSARPPVPRAARAQSCVKEPLIGCKGKEECLFCSVRWPARTSATRLPRATPGRLGAVAHLGGGPAAHFE